PLGSRFRVSHSPQSTHHSAGNQGVSTVRRLVAGAPRPAVHHGGAEGLRRVGAQETSEIEDLDAQTAGGSVSDVSNVSNRQPLAAPRLHIGFRYTGRNENFVLVVAKSWAGLNRGAGLLAGNDGFRAGVSFSPRRPPPKT